MSKIALIILLIIGINAKINANGLYEIVSEYRTNGLSGLKSKLERYLLDKAYWDSVLANIDTRFGYYESIKYIFVASKAESNLQLFEIKDNTFHQISSSNAIFGSNKADKKIQDDLATPIGVYNLTNKLQNLDQYYGPLAFVTSYPNLYDKLHKKTGYGIWIHGVPLNGDRDNATKGCIAIDNNTLLQYDKTINYKDSLLITTPNASLAEVSKNTLALILQGLFMWREAWVNNDLELYLSFYDESFMRFDGMKIDNFKAYKKRVFDKEESKTIEFSDINIAPYPNENNDEIFRITFLEDYNAKGGYKFKGTKELYIKVINNKMKILIEK